MEPRQALSPEGLPSGWYQGLDEKFGRPYYYNKLTRKSTWTRPLHDAAMSQQEEVKPRAFPSSPRCKKAWVEVFSPEYHRTYYFNRETRQSVWTRPAELDDVNVANASIAASAEKGLEGGALAGTNEERERTRSKIAVSDVSGLGRRRSTVSSLVQEEPALQQAWAEIDAAKAELERERDQHAATLRSEWEALQAQVSAMRELTIQSSFAPHSAASDALEAPQKEVMTATAGSGDASSPPVLSLPPGDKEMYLDESGSASGDDDLILSSNAYGAGALSELEDYAESLMRRRESLSRYMNSIPDSDDRPDAKVGRSRRPSLMAREESKRILRSARRARKGLEGAASDDSATESSDEDKTESQSGSGDVVGSKSLNLPWSSSSSSSSTEYDASMVGELVPAVNLDEEMEELQMGLKQVQVEAEATRQAQKMFQQLEEGCYYRVLQVPPDSASKDIKKAYLKLMLKWHPDRLANASAAEKERGTNKSVHLSLAYETLMDDWKRFLYDQMGLEQYLKYEATIITIRNLLWSGSLNFKRHPEKHLLPGPLRFKRLERKFIKRQCLWLSPDEETFNLGPVKILEPSEKDMEKIRVVRLDEIYDVSAGRKTTGLLKTGFRSDESLYFSIKIKNQPTIDLEASDEIKRNFFKRRMEYFVLDAQKNKDWFLRIFPKKAQAAALARRQSSRRVILNKSKVAAKSQASDY